MELCKIISIGYNLSLLIKLTPIDHIMREIGRATLEKSGESIIP